MKRKTIIKLTSVFLFIGILGSCASSHIYKGNRYYDAIAYSKAIPHLEKVHKKDPTRVMSSKLADSYFKVGELESAAKTYKNVIESSSEIDVEYFNYAKVLMALNRHDEAIVFLGQYTETHPQDHVAEMLQHSCKAVNDRYRDTTLYKLKPIETEGFQNTFSVTEYRDGVVFIADREVFFGNKKNPWTGDSYLDMYSMEKSEDGTWLDPELLKGDINGRFHEGPASFSNEGDIVYFTRSNYYKRKMEINDERENNLKIFKSTLVDGVWKNLEELPFNSDDYSVGHPALSPCCHTLYFVSDMPGGYGGTDIYKTDIVEGEWTTPKNLGPSINTAGNEMFPYYDEDGALYFSSDSHNSMGGLDVFITYFNGIRWAQPENLNYPVNSNKDDFGFIINKEKRTGFVSSSRENDDKIYEFTQHDPTFNLIGFAHIILTNIPVEGVTAEITNDETGEVTTVTSDAEGKFKLKLGAESSYELMCKKKGVFARTDEITTKGLRFSQDFYADFAVEEIVIDKPIVLENIYYDFDMWNIREDAAIELNKLVKLLKDNPTLHIEMGSHTDARGSDKYNEVLSDKRAHAAVDYLIASGIKKERLTWKGYGETVLVNGCKNDVECTDEEHQENRRTEFKVKKM